MSLSALQILSLIWSEGPISRTALADRTGLAHSSITRLTRILARQELIRAVELGESTGGRPPILLAFNENAGVILAVDLGSIHLRGALYNAHGSADHNLERPFVGAGAAAIETQVVDLVEDLRRAAEDAGKRPLAIAISVPGVVDQQNGVILKVTNLALVDFPIAARLQHRFALPVFIEHDTLAAAYAERYYGAGRGSENMIYITVSQGIGAGIVLGNRAYRGENGVAGEIGHVTIVRNGLNCACGRQGCLETVAGAAAIIRRARLLLEETGDDTPPLLASAAPLTIDAIVAAAHQHDRIALQVLAEAADYMAQAIGVLTCVLDVNTVIVGGEIAAAGEAFLAPLRASLPRYLFMMYPIAVLPAEMHRDASVKGVSMLALQRVFGLQRVAGGER